ncbi:hypothetical protein ACFXJ8_34470 [Nonomuraea sp. NPDC059194]
MNGSAIAAFATALVVADTPVASATAEPRIEIFGGLTQPGLS